MKKILSLLFALALIFSLSSSFVFANEIGNELENKAHNNDTKNDFKSNNKEETNIAKASDKDLFGDEQAFPFIAGLGKNAAH
tara:strand:+ start:992 stop:1237 length:246 start_codon:yes stop_codon:yes gene_type:complete